MKDLFSKKFALFWLLFLANAIPAVFRLDSWPLSVHPMFSETLSVNSVSAYQVYYKDEAGALRQIPIFCHKVAIYLFDRNIGEGNLAIVRKIIDAVAMKRFPVERGGLLVAKAQKPANAVLSQAFDKRVLAELPVAP